MESIISSLVTTGRNITVLFYPLSGLLIIVPDQSRPVPEKGCCITQQYQKRDESFRIHLGFSYEDVCMGQRQDVDHHPQQLRHPIYGEEGTAEKRHRQNK